MAAPEPGTVSQPARREGRRRTSNIYGTIVTAGVLAAGGNVLSSAALEVTVLVTLVVYWIAEQYAELLGEHSHAGHLPTLRRIRSTLADSWPMVTSSFMPLLALIVARVLGVSTFGAAAVALVVAVVLLTINGHAAGRAAGLSGVRLVLVTGTASALGIAMVALKAVLQRQHHLF